MILEITGMKMCLEPNYLYFYLHVSKGFRLSALLQRNTDAAHLSRPELCECSVCLLSADGDRDLHIINQKGNR